MLIRSYLELQSQWSDDKNCSEIHFIESAVSIVEEAPWIIQYVSINNVVVSHTVNLEKLIASSHVDK